MKKRFLNLMICIAAIGVLASIISLSLALCEWDKMRFWQGIATLLFNFYFLIIRINDKRHEL